MVYILYLCLKSNVFIYVLYMFYEIFIDVDIRLRLKDYQICVLGFGRSKDLCFSNIIFKYWTSFYI